MHTGDSLFAFSGLELRIDSLNQFKTDTTTAVYNLEVAGNNDFYVSGSKVLVHNTCKAGFTSFIMTLADRSAIMIELKIPNGFSIVHGVFSEGAEVFTNGKVFLSPSVTRHNGEIWKMAKKVEWLKNPEKRMGGYDELLNWVHK